MDMDISVGALVRIGKDTGAGVRVCLAVGFVVDVGVGFGVGFGVRDGDEGGVVDSVGV